MLLVVFGLAACEAKATVNVDVTEDGSGTVAVVLELDAEALGRIGGIDAIDTGELTEAGWDVAEPELVEGGSVRLRAGKAFGRPSDLQPTLEEITGPDGPFQGQRIEVLDLFGGTRYVFGGRLITEVNLTQFSDAGVADALDGLPLGRSAEDLAADLKANPGSLKLNLAVTLPGTVTDTNGESEAGAGEPIRWSADLTTDGTETVLSATSEERTDRPRQLVKIGGGLVLAAAALLLYGIWASRRLNRQRL